MKIVAYPGSFQQSVKFMLAEINIKITWIMTDKDAKICKFDRLLLLGGEDIWRGFYDPTEAKRPSLRDCIESRLIVRAQELGVPTLGICRGHQLLSAMNGAFLTEHIDRHTHESFVANYHKLGFIAEKTIFDIPPIVNSLHHQAAAVVPPNFTIMAKALDGTIEAMVSKDQLTAGVQYHPEILYKSIADNPPLLWLLRGPKPLSRMS